MKFEVPKVKRSDDIRFDNPRGGLTAIEVLIVVATLALLVLFALPLLSNRLSPPSKTIICASNLKQVNLSAQIWSYDHGEVLPWNAPISSNGVKELALSGDLAAFFRAMSNEVENAKVLACPSDSKRTKTSDWAKLKNSNISYFLGLDADKTKRETIMFGDRNISGGIFTSNRVMEAWSTNVLVWGADIHSHSGNIGLGDGSVRGVDDATLGQQMTAHHESFTQTTVARFAFP